MTATDRARRETRQRLRREASRCLGRPETHPEVRALAEDWLQLAERYRAFRAWADPPGDLKSRFKTAT